MHVMLQLVNPKPGQNMVKDTVRRLLGVIRVLALQLYVERLAKAVRKRRADAEKDAAEAQHAAAAGHLPTTGLLG